MATVGNIGERRASAEWNRSYEVKAVALLAAGFGVVGLDRFIINPLFPIMQKELGLPADEAVVQLTLEKLQQVHLLEGGSTPTVTFSRRQAAKRLAQFGIAAASFVVTIVAPPPALAAVTAHSCGSGNPVVGSACGASSDCGTGPDACSCQKQNATDNITSAPCPSAGNKVCLHASGASCTSGCQCTSASGCNPATLTCF